MNSNETSTRRAGPGRALAAIAALVAGAAALPGTAAASCFPPSSADLRALDRETDGKPDRAAAEARRLLAEPMATRDPLRTAELNAIAARADLEANRPGEVRAHVAAARAALAAVGPGAARDSVAIHLRSIEAIELILTGRPQDAARLVDAALQDTAVDSLARACVLTTRSLLHHQTSALGDAAADAIEAYEIARNAGGEFARVNAAYVLAAIYARVGLLPQAESMIDEVVAYADRERLVHMAMGAAFVRGGVLHEQGRFEAALATARGARELAVESGAEVSVAVATLGVCTELVELGRWAEAATACATGDAELSAAQRPDMLGELRAQRARIALARRQPREALRLLDAVLAEGATPVGPARRARYLQHRADAYRAVGESAQEARDLRAAAELEQRHYSRERLMAVAVIGAMNERSRWVADQRALQVRIGNQQRELAQQRRVRNLSVAFAAATLVLVSLLAFLLRNSMRQRQALRRQEAALRTIVEHAPDALVLLDGDRNVRYENRDLFGSTSADRAVRALVDRVPEPVASTLRGALDTVYEKRIPATALAVSTAEGQPDRYFEVHGAPVMEDGRLVGAVVRAADVTATHRLEREVVDASNRERLRLSSDLHEGLGQQLTGTMMLVQSIAAAAKRGRPADAGVLARVVDHLAEAIRAVRSLALDLSPVTVDRGSLSDALCRLALDGDAPGGVAVDTTGVAPDIVVSDEAADHLYRIAREALLNVRRHSGAARAVLELERQGDDLILTVADDGRGIDGAGPGAGLGLRMIEYRARLLGGSASVDSRPGDGTRITIVAAWARCRRPAA